MTSKKDDTLLKLQATIQSWTAEVTDAHNDLTRQIGQTKEQLSMLVRVLAPSDDESQPTSSIELIEREQAIARRDAEIEELRQTENRLRNEAAGLRSTVDDVLQHNARLTEAQQALTAELSALQTRQASELEDNGIVELQAQVEVLKERGDADVDTLKADFDSKTQEVEELKQRLDELAEELAQARTQGEAISKDANEDGENIDELRTELESARLDAEEATEGKEAAEAERDSAQHEAEALSTQLAETTGKTEELLKSLEETAEELERVKADREAALSSATSDTQNTDEAQAKLQEALRTAEDAAHKNEGLETERDAALEELETLNSTLAEATAKTEDLLKRLEDRTEELEEAKATQSEAQSHADTKNQSLETIQAELDSARRSLETNATALEEATRDAEQLRTDAAARDARIEELIEESAPLEAKASEKDFVLLKSKQDIQALEGELEELSLTLEQVPRLERENSDLKTSLEQAEAKSEETEAHTELDEIRSDLETFERYLVERESVLTSAATNLDKFQILAASIEERLADLEALPDLESGSDVENGLVNEIAELTGEIGLLREANVKFLHLQRDILKEEQNRILLATFDDEGRIRHMGQILVEAGVIDKEQLKEALRRQAISEGEPLGKILVEAGMTDDETIRQVLVRQLKLPFTQMNELNTARSDQAATSAAMQAALSESEELRAALAEKDVTIDEQARQKTDLEQSLDLIQQNLTELQHKSSKSSEKETQLNKRLDDTQEQIKTLGASLEEKTETAEDQGTQIREQDVSLKDFENRIEELLSHASGEKDDSTNLSQQLEEVTQRNESLRAALIQREVELETLKKVHAEAAQAIIDQGERISGAAYDASGRKRAMGEILVNAGIITEKQLENGLDEQRSSPQRRLGTILVEKGLIHEEIIAQVLASQLGLDFIRLSDREIEADAIGLMNGRLATHHMCIPIQRENGEVTVAMANPLDLIAIEDLEIATSLNVKPVVATLADITSAIVRCYGIDSGAPSDALSEK